MYKVENSVLDPVSTYERYVSKLHPENLYLFQKPKKNFIFEENVWYTKEVLGKNTISSIMKGLSQKAGLSKPYTNHCVRASTVTTLYQAGIDTQQICSITKHKNESTLSHYIESSSEKQKQIASNILSCAIIGEINDKDVGIVGKENEKEAV